MLTLLLPSYLVPVRPQMCVLEGHGIAIEDDCIVALEPHQDLRARYPDARVLALTGQVLMPGLINMHTHSPMSLLRGYADDLKLDDWLTQHIWPAEARWADADFVAQGSELAIAEMIRGGTTCFNENYFFPDQIAKVTERTGMRACIGLPVIDFATRWASEEAEYLEKGAQVRDQFSACPRVQFSIAPHSLYSVSNEGLAAVSEWSEAAGLSVHLHLLEAETEVEQSLQRHGVRPLQHAEQLGLLNHRLQAVHMAHLRDQDIELLAERKVHVVHCPQSNLKLASGMCRVTELLAAGVNVSIGTDGAASNNDLDLLNEMQTAALLAKGLSRDPCAVDAATALEMVTINAARALGMEHMIGSIEVGKQADVSALSLQAVQTQPVHHVLSNLVYGASSSQFTNVWVAGRQLLDDRKLTCMDETAVLACAADWASRMSVAPGRLREINA